MLEMHTPVPTHMRAYTEACVHPSITCAAHASTSRLPRTEWPRTRSCAMQCYKEYLAISRKVGDQKAEALACNSIGVAYQVRYSRAPERAGGRPLSGSARPPVDVWSVWVRAWDGRRIIGAQRNLTNGQAAHCAKHWRVGAVAEGVRARVLVRPS